MSNQIEKITEIVAGNLSKASLNAYGEQGWELCGVVSSTTGSSSSSWPAVIEYIFKKEKK